MGIRIDSDLQQPSVEDGHNPYTEEDLAPYLDTVPVYTPRQIDALCNRQDEFNRLMQETANLVSAISAAIERLSPIISDVYGNLERIQAVIEDEQAQS